MLLQSLYQKYNWSAIETKVMEMAYRAHSESIFDYEYSEFGKKYSHNLSECLDFLTNSKMIYKLSQRYQKGVDNIIVKIINIKFPEILDSNIFIHHIYLQNYRFLKRNYYSELDKKLLELNFEIQYATNNNKISLELDISQTNSNGHGDFDVNKDLKNELEQTLNQHLLNYKLVTKEGLYMVHCLEISGWKTQD